MALCSQKLSDEKNSYFVGGVTLNKPRFYGYQSSGDNIFSKFAFN